MPYWASTSARHAGWRVPKCCSACFKGKASLSAWTHRSPKPTQRAGRCPKHSRRSPHTGVCSGGTQGPTDCLGQRLSPSCHGGVRRRFGSFGMPDVKGTHHDTGATATATGRPASGIGSR